jgi:hypothetical protein
VIKEKGRRGRRGKEKGEEGGGEREGKAVPGRAANVR